MISFVAFDVITERSRHAPLAKGVNVAVERKRVSPDGSIVLVGSIADVIGTKGYGVYGATKAAVRSFARTWANELATRNIRINVVAPGPTDTAMMAAASDEVRETLTKLIPLGRMGRADEIASAALFLAGDQSSYITGAELPVDGGMAQV